MRDELIKKMEALHAEMKELISKSAEATDEQRGEMKKQLETKSVEMESLKADLEQVNKIEDAETMISKAKERVVVSKDFVVNPPKRVEVVNDKVKDERTKDGFLRDYLVSGKSAFVGRDVALDSINAASSDPRLSQYGVLAKVPRNLSNLISMKHDNFEAMKSKTVLSTDSTGYSTDSGAQHIYDTLGFQPELLQETVSIPTIYDLCRRIPAANGIATYPKLDQASAGNFGGVALTWKTTEGADKGETTPYFTDFTVSTHELSAWLAVSETILRRAGVDLSGVIAMLFRDACRYEWSNKVLNGTGSNQPYGVIGMTGVTTKNREVDNQVSWKDLTALEYGLTQGNRVGARFVLDDTVEKYLKEQLDTQKRPLFTADVNVGMRTNLGGYPYMTHEYTPALGTKGDVVLGNFMNYGFGVEKDMAIERSEHVEFKKGLIVYRLITFAGGKPIHPRAFSVLNVSA